MTKPSDDRLDHDEFPEAPVLRRQAIELELERIRRAASVARLEAREAELEALLRQIEVEPDSGTETRPAADVPAFPPPPARFGNWDEVRAAQTAVARAPGFAEPVDVESGSAESGVGDDTRLRFDGGHAGPRRPRFVSAEVSADRPVGPEVADSETADSEVVQPTVPQTTESGEVESQQIDVPETDEPFRLLTGDETPTEPNVAAVDFAAAAVSVDDEEKESATTRRVRPVAWLLSVAAHVALVIVLGWFTLTAVSPKDQLALTASPSETSEEEVQSLSIEAPQPEVEPNEPTTTDVEYDLSPVGEVYAAKFSPDPVEAPPSNATALLNQNLSRPVSLSKNPSAEPIEFCGIKGGGSHFVYLVDSSGSMGDAFASARLELLRSVSALRADQRFYVVFFDEKPDYMRLDRPDVDEPASVPATPQNLEKLRRWAMRIQMNRGRAPYEPLEFALSLKPDVIFLLSDGEFPERIVELLAEQNRVENLFGDVKPISIVHTIGYHSREGEQRMRVIAKNNQGQYRYVPDPGEMKP